MKDEEHENGQAIYGYWGVVKAFALIALISVLSYKIIITPFQLVIDFPTLLSLLLAFFSVGLAALFYFKATESSNTFYDNTYKFTRDIAQLLTKIESGFGERLKHLDEGYTSMREHIQKMPVNQKVSDAKRKIEEEEEIIDKTSEERNELIQQLLERAQMEEEERMQFIAQLKEKEESLENAHEEVSKLKRRLIVEKLNRRRESEHPLMNDEGFIEYFKENVIEALGGSKVKRMPSSIMSKRFASFVDELGSGFIRDLIHIGVIEADHSLTSFGIKYIRDLARSGYE